ncbi:vegetative incompatibility protein HET-E-1, putative, partial [Rhizoctonia solani AG-3 Rhs1AP]
MDFKRIFKWKKKIQSGNEPHGSPSKADTPTPDASIQSTSPTPTSSVAVSALPEAPLEQRPKNAATINDDTWTNLTAFLDLLNQSPVFGPLAAVIDELTWFITAHEDVVTTRMEYEALRSQLETLFKDLHTHFSQGTPPAMTTSMLNLCEAIQNEIRQVYGTQDRNTISRYMQANRDLDKITGCYRRVQGHLERVMSEHLENFGQADNSYCFFIIS